MNEKMGLDKIIWILKPLGKKVIESVTKVEQSWHHENEDGQTLHTQDAVEREEHTHYKVIQPKKLSLKIITF